MKDVFSYIVFATLGSSIVARRHLWCWLATVARRLLLYGCAQRLRETKWNVCTRGTLRYVKKSTCSYILECVSRVCTVLFYDEYEINLVRILSCCSFASRRRWLNFGDEKNADLCCAAQHAKAGKEAIQTMQEAVTV